MVSPLLASSTAFPIVVYVSDGSQSPPLIRTHFTAAEAAAGTASMTEGDRDDHPSRGGESSGRVCLRSPASANGYFAGACSTRRISSSAAWPTSSCSAVGSRVPTTRWISNPGLRSSSTSPCRRGARTRRRPRPPRRRCRAPRRPRPAGRAAPPCAPPRCPRPRRRASAPRGSSRSGRAPSRRRRRRRPARRRRSTCAPRRGRRPGRRRAAPAAPGARLTSAHRRSRAPAVRAPVDRIACPSQRGAGHRAERCARPASAAAPPAARA